MLTQERLKELLDYDPETGVFVWKIAKGKSKKGSKAGCLNKCGYIYIGIDKNYYYAHRLAWFYVHNCWPTSQIDHINRVPSDNRLANLRIATKSENEWNKNAYKNNKSGYAGVYLDKHNNKWKAQITKHGKTRTLGYFNTPEEANASYVRAKAEHHKF